MKLEEYPKEVVLKDKETMVVLRPMVADDKDKLLTFFRKLPEIDRLYLRSDVTKEEVVDKWVKNLNYEKVLPILALVGKEVVADATLHRSEYSWTKHVGEIRIVVAPTMRKKGLGAILAKELFHQAMLSGVEKIIVEMAEEDEPAKKVFEKMGFKKEAILKNHIIDVKGKKHNLLIMSNNVEDLLEKLEYLGEEISPSRSMEG